MSMKTITKTSISSIAPQCSKSQNQLHEFFGLNSFYFFSISDTVNGIGDFADDYTNDEDLDTRNKMFEEVSHR